MEEEVSKEYDLQNGQSGSAEGSSAPKLFAYRVSPWPPMRLVTATASRDWMEATPNRFANRCLPLRIANQAGWFVLNSHPLRVTWTGGNERSDLEIESLGEEANYPVSSHFGSGILTFNLPFLFRTLSGYNLQVRGPANWPKDGAYPLEGIVETDWAVSTFTMNWKLTRAELPVVFEEGEPICMIVPQRRGELETFRPEIRELDEELETAGAYRQWAASRAKFNQDLKVAGSEAVKRGWQKDYVRGTTLGGLRAEEHQTKLKLKGFSGG
jgi:hypothetical protein